jgi:hypothetical protein
MRHSSTLSIGLDVQKESIAVAYVAHAHDAEVIYLGTLGTRQADICSELITSGALLDYIVIFSWQYVIMK